MITHNMRDAIAHGNRLIMMNEGRIILDIEGEEKKCPFAAPAASAAGPFLRPERRGRLFRPRRLFPGLPFFRLFW
jgi:energy-coupling factor transporter ATP-binding protein EcfA2